MEAESYLLSPFSYQSGMEFEILAEKNQKEVELKGNEVAIIRMLAKYKVLNKRCLAEGVAQMQPSGRRRNDYSKEMELLFQGGYIIKYQYPNRQGRSNTVLYALSEKGISYATAKKIMVRMRNMSPKGTPVFDTTGALETAALNSWHIRMLGSYPQSIRMELYDYMARVERGTNVMIPSCMHLKHDGEGFFLKELTVAALPFEKQNTLQSEGRFLNRLLAVNSFLRQNERNFKNPFLIVLADGFPEIDRASVKLQSYDALEQFQVYYAIDEFTNSLSPLQWLYDVNNDKETGKTRYTLINLLQQS